MKEESCKAGLGKPLFAMESGDRNLVQTAEKTAFPGDKLLIRSAFHHAAAIHDKNAIRVTECIQSMGYHQNGPVPAESIKTLPNQRLGSRRQRAIARR